MTGGCRLAEALGVVSLTTDTGAGQPQQTALGATIIATRLARSSAAPARRSISPVSP